MLVSGGRVGKSVSVTTKKKNLAFMIEQRNWYYEECLSF